MSSSPPARCCVAVLASVIVSLCVVVTARAADAPRVAVLDFTNGAGGAPELTPLGKGLQSMLITDLAAVEGVTLIERERLQEVLGELSFQQSEHVDPATASALGELLGVTHLLTGSFVVAGETMRLDARLLDLRGVILLATEATGEREAFFELEKQLARGIAARLAELGGTSLAPRSRAQLARIHTADFAAFRTFSEGLAAFDRADYDAALERLRAASDADDQFDLARLTLEDYEQIVTRLRARSVQLETGRKERERLALEGERGELGSVLARLWEIAEQPGAAAQRARATAIYLLAVAYSNIGTNKGKLLRLREVEDRFAMARAADALALAWRAEAAAAWPALPPLVSDRFWRQLPEAATFDADFAEAIEHLWSFGADHPENRRHYFLMDMRYPAETARLLHLDRADEVRLLDEMGQRGRELGAPDYWLEDLDEARVAALRSVLRLDESTKLVTDRVRGETNEHRVRAAAEEVERNKELARVLAQGRAHSREWLLLASESRFSHGPLIRFAEQHLAGVAPDAEGLYHLNRAREVDADDVLLVGAVPVWTHQGQWRLRTGPRRDLRRTDSLRYSETKTEPEAPTLLLLGGTPTATAVFEMTLDPTPPADYWPPRISDRERPEGLQAGDVPTGRPTVSILLGLRDVDCKTQRNPHTEKYELARPMTGWRLALAPDGRLTFARVVEAERGSYDRKERFADAGPVQSGPVVRAGRGGRVHLTVRVQGNRVTVGGDAKASFTTDKPADGFLGILLEGPGYVGIQDLSLKD